ncbi:unnamed protein product [Phytophthora fragariaefolia]|uniref:Unnamed protein product n=1 Tax=Phytophthora fragariaefolia TaxID=1490495 RepID=A0A9W7DB46_9STRA|nr:unnamed protein product [Phytophthora fragariaefolia]
MVRFVFKPTQNYHENREIALIGGKCKADRVQVIHWVEEAVSDENENQSSDRKIEYMFNELGQDPRQPNSQLFQEHMSQLKGNECIQLSPPESDSRRARVKGVRILLKLHS